MIVTPFKFRAVTSSPNGKWRSIFLTGGVVRNFFNASLSSKVAGEVLSFLVVVSIMFLMLLNELLPRVSLCIVIFSAFISLKYQRWLTS